MMDASQPVTQKQGLSSGESKSEALRMLAEALELHEGGGEPVSADDLREFGLDPKIT